MDEIPCNSWHEFESELESFFDSSMQDRDRYAFRGQANANWALTSTLERFADGVGESNLELLENVLLDEFLENAVPTLPELVTIGVTERLIIARHHGLPGSILDLTLSPYIATYFACSDPIHRSADAPDRIAIVAMNRARLADDVTRDDYEFIEGFQFARWNPRAVAQQAFGLKLRRPEFSFESLFKPGGIVKITLPASEIDAVLARLAAMNISADQMFGGLDGAAMFAQWRVRILHRKAER